MSALRERLGSIRIEVTSPGGVVSLAGTGTGAVGVTVHEGRLAGAGDDGLARELDTLIATALAETRREYRLARGSARTTVEQIDEALIRPILRFQDEAAKLAWTATSAGGHITVSRDERRRVRVRVLAGTVRSLAPADLVAEIESALRAAVTTHQEAMRGIRRTVYGTSLGLPDGVRVDGGDDENG